MKKILVTGGCGYLGPNLIEELLKRGLDVVCLNNPSSQRKSNISKFKEATSFTAVDCDVRDRKKLEEIIQQGSIDTIFHLASLLSVNGEENPNLTWDVNVNGLRNILDIARENKPIVFWPSSMAVFGPTAPKENTPQGAILEPTTMYGKTKVVGEQLCAYYAQGFGVRFRSIRLVGNITHQDIPIGSITGYAVEMLHSAVRDGEYVCYLKEDTTLPLIYLPDTIRVIMELMESPLIRIKQVAYNMNALSFSPKQLELEIKKHIKGFNCTYQPDKKRQRIANSWPKSIDDSNFRMDFQWRPAYDFSSMVEDMIKKLRVKYQSSQ